MTFCADNWAAQAAVRSLDICPRGVYICCGLVGGVTNIYILGTRLVVDPLHE